MDAEVVMEDYDLLEGLIERVQREKGIILHLTDNASRWGMIDIPDGYRERAIFYKQVENLSFYILIHERNTFFFSCIFVYFVGDLFGEWGRVWTGCPRIQNDIFYHSLI
jgi:hypothetical protein